MSKWDDLVVYQIYPKSFQDSNGDGIGDIPGITARLDYLHDLGINMLWLNPIFVSPQVDNGYDVSDYFAIDPAFGTMEDVETLIAEAHKRGIKIIFDLVLSHTSDQHPWFQEARTSKDNRYRDFFLWADGKQPISSAADAEQLPYLPNNWQSFFGGSVWAYDEPTKQYYFHLFDRAMPDLNWRNPEVREAMAEVARFWLEKGVDGFRVDAFIHVVKELGYPDVAWAPEGELSLAEHYYANLPLVNDYMKEFSDALRRDYPDVYLVGEASSATPELGYVYTNSETGYFDSVITFRYFHERLAEKAISIPDNLQTGHLDWAQFKQAMHRWLHESGGIDCPTLYWNNHDMARVVGRFGDVTRYRDRSAKMLASLMYLQRGTPYLYYGEELGMVNFDFLRYAEDKKTIGTLTPEQQKDVALVREKGRALGMSEAEIADNLNTGLRDGSRGLMQWDGSKRNNGFSPAQKCWTGHNEDKRHTVAAEQQDSNSVLQYYKAVLRLRKEAPFAHGSWHMLPTDDGLFIYERNSPGHTARVINNLSNEARSIWLDSYWQHAHVLLSNVGRQAVSGELTLLPYESLVIKGY